MVLQVKNSPFDEEQVELLNRLLPNTTEAQQIWLSGYLTALYGSAATASAGVAVLERPEAKTEQVVAVKEVTVLYGSQTGNSQGIAEELSNKLKEQKFNVTLTSMSDFKPNALKKIEHLFIVVSTQGEGDPPDTAIQFHEFLHSKRAPKLDQLRFSVLSLGDSSYEFFCQTGKEFDSRLEELGATRLTPRVDCDLDYDDSAAEWFENVLSALDEVTVGSAHSSHDSAAAFASDAGQSTYSRTRPFQAEVFENINLNGRGSNKETRHLELSLEGSGLEYEPGDSLGIYPENDGQLVDALIQEAGWNPNESIPINKQGERRSLREALLHHYEITVLTKPLLEQASQFTKSDTLRNLLKPENAAELRSYIVGRDLQDVLRDFGPWNVSASEFVSILRKLPARLYSIASSLQANPDEVHVTVGVVRYEAHGRDRNGVCSVQLAERVEPGDTLPVYIHKNPNFKLPENPDTPIIMIGPGTGVAPFRSFLEEREETGAVGKSWLFFGDQHYVTDFLYQIEWQRWLKEGVLTKLDVAFSRDTDEKIYVQHRMQAHSRELYQWIEDGAVLYVCGDEQYMAKDVHSTLISILENEGGMSTEMAEAYLTKLQQQKRYQRDVY
ncbi:assimilatory sulfite reductase (NADPH) flavoprotein subunit [Sporosarcina sp. 179-K 3D1 HS]|uniref:assimilatory sulfite reductase (NADPH) flavoprotein subunit n=1 Tax=Sporosarcina sp. 179-K 3D1 HS TaxID=3232169 RepID=UPI0039A1D962